MLGQVPAMLGMGGSKRHSWQRGAGHISGEGPHRATGQKSIHLSDKQALLAPSQRWF